MTMPASIDRPKPASSSKAQVAPSNFCRRPPPISIPLNTPGSLSNSASANTFLFTTAICLRQWMPYSLNDRHLSGKDYNKGISLAPEWTALPLVYRCLNQDRKHQQAKSDQRGKERGRVGVF